MSNPKQLVNLPNCNSCNTWGSPGGDGSGNIAWQACTTKNSKLAPTPSYSGGDGMLSLNDLQDALNNNFAQPIGNCNNSTINPDPDLSGYNQDCEQCYQDGIAYTGNPARQENFLTGFVNSSSNPSSYLSLRQTWSIQKPYNL